MKYNKLKKSVKNYVTDYFNEHRNPKLVYHSLAHTKRVVKAAKQIARNYRLSNRDFFILYSAAYFHDIGYLNNAQEHEMKSALMAEKFLSKNKCNESVRNSVIQAILSTAMPQSPQTIIEEILCDADISNLGEKNFKRFSDALRKETMGISGAKISRSEWLAMDIRFFESTNYHTEYAKINMGPQKDRNLKKLHSGVCKEIPMGVPIIV